VEDWRIPLRALGRIATARDDEGGEVDGDGEADEKSADGVKPVALDLAGWVEETQKDQAGGEAEAADGDEATGSGVELAEFV
jgi:hypothetical protein